MAALLSADEFVFENNFPKPPIHRKGCIWLDKIRIMVGGQIFYLQIIREIVRNSALLQTLLQKQQSVPLITCVTFCTSTNMTCLVGIKFSSRIGELQKIFLHGTQRKRINQKLVKSGFARIYTLS